MPGFDGKGPVGYGPVTGQGSGYCLRENSSDAGRAGTPGFTRGRGRASCSGRGRGRRMGKGMGFKRGFCGGFGRIGGFAPYAYQAHPYPHGITADDEMTYLKKVAAYLEEQIKEIHKRISDLNKEETPES